MRQWIWIAAAVALGAQCACADAWTQREGGYLVKLALSRIDTRRAFDASARSAALFAGYPGVRDGEYTSTDVHVYAEYGASDAFTLLGAAQWKSSNSLYDDSGLVARPNGGMGDVYAAGRLALLTDPFAAAVQVGWKIPLGDTGSVTAVALGDGAMSFDATASAGYVLPIPGAPAAVQMKWGFLFRGGNYDNAIVYAEQVGFTAFHNAAGVRASFEGEIAQGAVPPLDTLAINTGFGIRNNLTFSRLTLGAVVRLSPKAMLTLDWATIVSGRGCIAGNTVSIGVAFARQWNSPLAPQ